MNTLQAQFRDALKRESKTITTYYNNESVQCLFRKVNDKDENEYLAIYYDVNAPIRQGQLLSYKDKYFLTLNQESVENDTYYKSSLIQCNTVLETVYNLKRRYIPCFASDLSSPIASQNSVITTLDGRVELKAEQTEIIDNIKFGDAFTILGGNYELENKFIKSGISHLFIKYSTKNPVEPIINFSISAENNQYQVETTATITYTATIDGVETVDPIIEWTSSNELVATVTDGVVSFLDIGSVNITALWAETEKSQSLTFTVVESPVLNVFKLAFSSYSGELMVGGREKTFTATLADTSGTPIDFTPIWSYDYESVPSSKLTFVELESTTVGTHQLTVQAEDDSTLQYKTFTVTCATSDGAYSQSYTVTLV